VLAPRLLALLLAASALSLAACDGDTEEKNDYVDQVNAVTSTLNEGLTSVSTEATAIDSPEQVSGVFAKFASSLDTAAADIDGIEPPEDVVELHDQLVEQVKSLATEAQNAADEVRAGGPAAVPGVAGQFVSEATRGGSEIDSTISEINSKLQG
jgi:hypothetical protein